MATPSVPLFFQRVAAAVRYGCIAARGCYVAQRPAACDCSVHSATTAVAFNVEIHELVLPVCCVVLVLVCGVCCAVCCWCGGGWPWLLGYNRRLHRRRRI